MSTVNTGGPAFAVPSGEHMRWGDPVMHDMSLRDYIATRAMQSFLADPDVSWASDSEMDFAAGKAYKMADAMLRARSA